VNFKYVLSQFNADFDIVLRYSIRLGEHDINTEVDGARHQDILISSRTSHESFDSVSFRNDIAVLKLSKRAEFNGNIQFSTLSTNNLN